MSEMKQIKRVKVCGGYLEEYKHDSKSVKGSMHFGIYHPPSDGKTKHPALFYLSGLTCSPKNCIEKGGVYEHAAKHGIIVVFPDTSPRDCEIEGDRESWDFGVAASFYVDATQGKYGEFYNMHSYISKELPEVLKSKFDNWNGIMSITGHSMGGHGALVAYLKNPGLFRSVSAFAPICNPVSCPWGVKAFSGYLGSDKTKWADWDATELIKKYKGVKKPILVDQGLEDGFLGKKQLLPEVFKAVCDSVGQPLVLRMHEGYDHSYYFVSSFMEDHVAFHSLWLKSA
ncbi:hypothetical protein AAMO2058_000686400 [Amorphochlora amoebiformis]